MTKQEEFIKTLAPIVQNECKRRIENNLDWITPSIVIAQAALESGWNLNAKTLFGIKGSGSNTQTLLTSEYVNGHFVQTTANFVVSNTIIDAVEYYYRFMSTNKRYKPCLNSNSYVTVAKQLSICGYATDPKYADKILSIIKLNKLYNYDCFKPEECLVNETVVLKQGCKIDKEIIKIWQLVIGTEEDGIFGPKTENATLLYIGKKEVTFEDFIKGVERYGKKIYKQ